MFGFQKKREVEGEKWRECVRIDCEQKAMIQQDNTLIFLFLNCNKFPLMYSILQSKVTKLSDYHVLKKNRRAPGTLIFLFSWG